MSIDITVQGGTSKRLLTAGKYCPQDIVVTAEGGGGANQIDALLDGSLTELDSDALTLVRYKCYNMASLVRVNLQKCTTLDIEVFNGCTALKEFNAPCLTTIGTYCFKECKALEKIAFPLVVYVQVGTFYRSGLRMADFTAAVSIDRDAFMGCTKLDTLILRRTGRVCALYASGTSPIAGTLIAKKQGFVYVPAALVDTYKSASGWSTYAEQFRALEDYTVDGTIYGELDESKI